MPPFLKPRQTTSPTINTLGFLTVLPNGQTVTLAIPTATSNLSLPLPQSYSQNVITLSPEQVNTYAVELLPLTTTVPISIFPKSFYGNDVPTPTSGYIPTYQNFGDGSLITPLLSDSLMSSTCRLILVVFLLSIFIRNTLSAIGYLWIHVKRIHTEKGLSVGRSWGDVEVEGKARMYMDGALVFSQLLGVIRFGMELNDIRKSFGNADGRSCFLLLALSSMTRTLSFTLIISVIMGLKAWTILNRPFWLPVVIGIFTVAWMILSFINVAQLNPGVLARSLAGRCKSTKSTLVLAVVVLMFTLTLILLGCFVYALAKLTCRAKDLGRTSVSLSLRGSFKPRPKSPSKPNPKSKSRDIITKIRESMGSSLSHTRKSNDEPIHARRASIAPFLDQDTNPGGDVDEDRQSRKTESVASWSLSPSFENSPGSSSGGGSPRLREKKQPVWDEPVVNHRVNGDEISSVDFIRNIVRNQLFFVAGMTLLGTVSGLIILAGPRGIFDAQFFTDLNWAFQSVLVVESFRYTIGATESRHRHGPPSSFNPPWIASSEPRQGQTQGFSTFSLISSDSIMTEREGEDAQTRVTFDNHLPARNERSSPSFRPHPPPVSDNKHRGKVPSMLTADRVLGLEKFDQHGRPQFPPSVGSSLPAESRVGHHRSKITSTSQRLQLSDLDGMISPQPYAAGSAFTGTRASSSFSAYTPAASDVVSPRGHTRG